LHKQRYFTPPHMAPVRRNSFVHFILVKKYSTQSLQIITSHSCFCSPLRSY